METIGTNVVLTLSGVKGGCAKSSSATSLACIFAEMGYTVLLIDTDGQANASSQFGVDALQGSEIKGTISDILLERKTILQVATPTGIERVSLVPSSIVAVETELELSGRQGSDLRLEVALQESRAMFDVTIIDSPPNLGRLSLNALAACDYFISPCDSAWALKGVDILTQVAERNSKFYRINNRFLGVFMTMVDNTRISRALREETEARWPDQVFHTGIRRATIAREAAAMSTPIPVYDKEAGVSEDYRNLAQEIVEKIGL